MHILIQLALNVLALLVVDYVVPGFHIDGIRTAIVAAIVIGVINTFIRPVIQIIALPISILTLGIFAFLINVTLLWYAALIVPGFEIATFASAAISAIALSLVNAFLHNIKEK